MPAARSGQVPASRRWAAVVALAAAAVIALELVVILARNLGHLALSLIGVYVAGAGAWWVVTEVGRRRLMGWAMAIVGAVAVVLSIAWALAGAESVLVPVVVLAVLGAVVVVAGRHALIADEPPLRVRMVEPPRRPVLLCNLGSGGGKVERFGLLDMAAERGIETVVLEPGRDLERLARDAVARGADCLGMAGGDGSQAVVASVAVEHDLPFVCVSAGTRNHFAQDLGLSRDDPRPTMAAFADGIERRVDLGRVGGKVFVNNVSLGVYATVVQEEGYREAKVDTAATMLPEILGRQAEPFDLQFDLPDGSEIDGAFLVMVSNNPYVLGISMDAAQRRTMESGLLGVFAVDTPTGRDAAALVALTAIGQRNRSPFWHELTCGAFEVRSRSGTVFAGVDGEAMELATPLRCEAMPGALRLLVPRDNPSAVHTREARDARVRHLVAIARGRDPLVERHAG